MDRTPVSFPGFGPSWVRTSVLTLCR